MTAISLFVNPAAGRGRARHAIRRIHAALGEAGIRADTHVSERPGDLEAGVDDAVRRGSGPIVIAGGDGSFHDGINGLLRAGGERIGLLPLGTGNDFAKSAGIPHDPVVAARALGQRLATGTPLGRFDAGICNERYFHNGAGIGLDARIARIAASVRLPIGDLVYAWGIVRCLVEGIATPSMTITADGEPIWSGPATLVNVANGRWVGSRFLIAPGASTTDGYLDLVVADAVTRRRIVSLIPRVRDGRHVDAPEVTMRSVRAARIACESPIAAHLDGEVQCPAEAFEVRCLESALELL